MKDKQPQGETLTCPVCGVSFQDSENLCFFVGDMEKTCSWKCFLKRVRSAPKPEPRGRKKPKSTNEIGASWAKEREEQSSLFQDIKTGLEQALQEAKGHDGE